MTSVDKPTLELSQATEEIIEDMIEGWVGDDQPRPDLEQMRRAFREDCLRLIRTVQKQLPKGMEHCTIQFKQCEVGHGRLTATNWIDNGCHWCEITRLKGPVYLWGLDV